MSASQGEKIIRLHDLFKTYSTLELALASDRPIAIDGIHSRLLGVFGARGGYGVFDKGQKSPGLLRRNLLWYRPDEVPTLERIMFPMLQQAPPSWSWMAYMGKIDFLRLEFDKIEWKEVHSPWSTDQTAAQPYGHAIALRRGSDMALQGRIRDIDMEGGSDVEMAGKLQFDIPSEGGGDKVRKLQCVVLGVKKGTEALEERRHYFILVRPTGSSRSSGHDFERVGAGYLPGLYLSATRQDAWIY